MITVFTPTYNRAYILGKLYKSLCEQSYKDFEWLIIDDGSTDTTESLVNSFQKKGLLSIKYFKQENGGKHRAINRGVREAQGDAFFIVDSDDRLLPHALEWVNQTFESIKNDSNYAGISGIRVYPNGESISPRWEKDIIDASAIEIREKYHVRGDLAEIYKTSILSQYPFPEDNNEKFCLESLVWNRIAQKYKLRYVYEPIYIGEYRPDGLTAKSVLIRQNSPINTMTTYAELSKYSSTLCNKIKSAINFWRFAPSPKSQYGKHFGMCSLISILARPAGKIMQIRDRKRAGLSKYVKIHEQ